MRISDWSSDVCSSDLRGSARTPRRRHGAVRPTYGRSPRSAVLPAGLPWSFHGDPLIDELFQVTGEAVPRRRHLGICPKVRAVRAVAAGKADRPGTLLRIGEGGEVEPRNGTARKSTRLKYRQKNATPK